MLKPTKILVPTDFSEYSDKALQQAIDIAREYRARLYLLHVVPRVSPSIEEYFAGDEKVRAMEGQVLSGANQKLKEQMGRARHADEIDSVFDLRLGVPYDEILAYEKEKECDLIVIASLGRTGLAQYIIGSVARNVLRGSTGMVLLTR